MAYTTQDDKRRIFVIVLDGVGAGALPDAADYGDVGAHTLAHTAEAVGGLNLPNMARLGLGNITPIAGVAPQENPRAAWGKMREASPGKDTITGHWEIAGIILPRPFPTYPNGFPPEIIAAFEQAIGTKTLGNYAASGTEIIAKLGAEHVRTGFPIVYTSADSVFQIAMHESVLPIERQYEICEIARHQILTGENEVGRVICRPFTGGQHRESGTGNGERVGDWKRKKDAEEAESAEVIQNPKSKIQNSLAPFTRTEQRKDFPVPPPPTVLDELTQAGFAVHAIGKIYEIFDGQGIATWDHTTNNAAHTQALQTAAKSSKADLIFANLEDFDMLYGHRNDPQGMARALETWDAALPAILDALHPGDIFIITADHGNDPTTPSTDHSREYPFLLAYVAGRETGESLGARATYADIAATIREAFALPPGANGTSFLPQLEEL